MNINVGYGGTLPRVLTDEESFQHEYIGEMFQKRITVAMRSKIDPIFDKGALSSHIEMEVLAKIDTAESMSEINNAMQKVYAAMPELKAFVNDFLGKDEKESSKKFWKWLKGLFKAIAVVIKTNVCSMHRSFQ